MDDTYERVKRIIVEHLNVDAERVVNGADLQSDLGADSLDLVELIMACEEEFDIEVSDDDAERIITVKNIVDYIDKKRA